MWTEELLPTPKITTFLPQSKFWAEKSEGESNSIPYLKWEYLSELTFLVYLTAPKKQSFTVNSAFESCDYLPNSKKLINLLKFLV